ncbi:hypothetical protein AXG93_4874s1220 [Marchantia polymorpha subsp. ruderalis]|uniref:Uncharacterized protein n=1 Tax=Marchantia polymorpha subsp. ruderalis TaxID=1480154 RepID=A0A176WF99_MARPO|nr:hypothetical protein AXG93_4874s1220 [Marchantia polymorpha subsp. ruderalis]
MSPHSVPDGDAKANGVRRAVIDNGRCPVPPEMDFLGVQGHQLFIEVRDVGPLALYKVHKNISGLTRTTWAPKHEPTAVRSADSGLWTKFFSNSEIRSSSDAVRPTDCGVMPHPEPRSVPGPATRCIMIPLPLPAHFPRSGALRQVPRLIRLKLQAIGLLLDATRRCLKRRRCSHSGDLLLHNAEIVLEERVDILDNRCRDKRW